MKLTFPRVLHQCKGPTTFCRVLSAGVLFPLSLASSRPCVGECSARAGLKGPESGCWRWKVFPSLSAETSTYSIYKTPTITRKHLIEMTLMVGVRVMMKNLLTLSLCGHRINSRCPPQVSLVFHETSQALRAESTVPGSGQPGILWSSRIGCVPPRFPSPHHPICRSSPGRAKDA